MSAYEHLWAPWRSAYVQNARALAEQGCLFCSLATTDTPRDRLCLYRSPQLLLVLNLYPYATGHLMVAPSRHWASPLEATVEAHDAVCRAVVYAERVLRHVYRPDGLNVGMNLGEAAGAGVPRHYHVHLVPRWRGDTNFMAAVAGTRVHPEAMATTQERLAPFFDEGFLEPDHPLFAAGAEPRTAESAHEGTS